MTDERLRDLERRFQETGSPADEEAYLVERVRAGKPLDWDRYSRLSELNLEAAAIYLQGRAEQGELTQERLERAAGLGDGPSREATGLLEGAPSDPIAVLLSLDGEVATRLIIGVLSSLMQTDWQQSVKPEFRSEVTERAALAWREIQKLATGQGNSALEAVGNLQPRICPVAEALGQATFAITDLLEGRTPNPNNLRLGDTATSFDLAASARERTLRYLLGFE